MVRKVIITAALTGGVHGKAAHPGLPEQPEEIIQAAYECYNAGAAIVHIHARDRQGKPTSDPAVYRRIHEGIRAKCNLVLQDTTGGGPNLTPEQRIQAIEAQPEMASLNMGTLVRTIGEYKGTVFRNTREDIEYFITEMNKRGIKPELEVYSHAMMEEVERLIEKGLLSPPYAINLVLNQPYQGALRGSVRNLLSLFTDYLPANAVFTVTAIGSAQLPLTIMSMLLGGNVRVGLEDNIYYRKGELAKSNAQLVERAVRIARELEIEVASPDEAREILGLKQTRDVN
ncbi:MAG: 3-keto-5-aminohexanoate cleavage protein [Bacillota bacterium]